jgi:hypothetical protein
MKAIELLSLLPWRSGEFVDRTSAIVAARWDSTFGVRPVYRTVDREACLHAVLDILGGNEQGFLGDPALMEIERLVKKRQAGLPAKAPFGSFHNGDSLLGRFCHVAGRALKAKLIVETGVCYGVTSCYLLQALEENGSGVLHSIDLPPLSKSGDNYIGWLVPSELRKRWTLHRGTSRRQLPPLLRRLGQIDLFVHDSLHTYGNMKMEFTAAWHALRAGGMLISDDIEGNRAFLELARRDDVAFSAVVREGNKNALLGVAVKRE